MPFAYKVSIVQKYVTRHIGLFFQFLFENETKTNSINNRSRRTCVRSLMDVEGGLLCEPLQADVTLVRPLPGMGSVVDFQILLARERRRTLKTLERPSLNCIQQNKLN